LFLVSVFFFRWRRGYLLCFWSDVFFTTFIFVPFLPFGLFKYSSEFRACYWKHLLFGIPSRLKYHYFRVMSDQCKRGVQPLSRVHHVRYGPISNADDHFRCQMFVYWKVLLPSIAFGLPILLLLVCSSLDGRNISMAGAQTRNLGYIRRYISQNYR
jgi:hypothetical protein